jgi:hypothetical protein
MKRVVVLSLLTLTMVVIMAGSALAATPQDVYNDFAADEKLNGPYTMAELEAYLDDATVHQYGSEGVLGPLDSLVTKILGIWRENPNRSWQAVLALATTSAADKPNERRKFPFTGFEMFLAGMGGLALIGGGIAVRRTTK